MATSTAVQVVTLGKYVDSTVTFRGFPGTGTVRYNQPHLSIVKNGREVHTEQVLFNGGTYQADLVRQPVVSGDVVQVCTRWAADETRDGSVQANAVIASLQVP